MTDQVGVRQQPQCGRVRTLDPVVHVDDQQTLVERLDRCRVAGVRLPGSLLIGQVAKDRLERGLSGPAGAYRR